MYGGPRGGGGSYERGHLVIGYRPRLAEFMRERCISFRFWQQKLLHKCFILVVDLGPEFRSGRGIQEIKNRDHFCVHLKVYAISDMGLITR